MISLYGAGKIAAKYLQEMIVGLQQQRHEHPRLALFARVLNVFDDVVETPVLLFTTEVLAAALRTFHGLPRASRGPSMAFHEPPADFPCPSTSLPRTSRGPSMAFHRRCSRCC